jgi:hypothetical protein
MTIQLTAPVPPPQLLVTARPVEIPLESRQVAPAAVPPTRAAYAQRDEEHNRTERERDDRNADSQSGSQSSSGGRGSKVDISA